MRAMKEERCREWVDNTAGYGWDPHQCSRRATKVVQDATSRIVGQYCAQHAKMLAGRGLRAGLVMTDIEETT